jgi:hypothetical protein
MPLGKREKDLLKNEEDRSDHPVSKDWGGRM